MADVAVSEHVIAYTLDGRKLEFDVVRVQKYTLAGEHERVTFADISHLEVERVDGSKTGGAVGFSAVAALIIFRFIVPFLIFGF